MPFLSKWNQSYSSRLLVSHELKFCLRRYIVERSRLNVRVWKSSSPSSTKKSARVSPIDDITWWNLWLDGRDWFVPCHGKLQVRQPTSSHVCLNMLIFMPRCIALPRLTSHLNQNWMRTTSCKLYMFLHAENWKRAWSVLNVKHEVMLLRKTICYFLCSYVWRCGNYYGIENFRC